jgi:alpha-1,6-mannosyltransferase
MILYGPIILYEGFLRQRLGPKFIILWSLKITCLSIAITFLFDSWFWKKWVWPELYVWYFNVILNQSSLWGKSPFHYYFSRFIPRAFLFNLPAIFYGLWEAKDRRHYAFFMILFVALYSFLPHKELRFIIYTFPFFCMYGAWGWVSAYRKGKASMFSRLLCIFFSCSLGITFLSSLFSAYISSYNYPAGTAMLQLHEKIPKNTLGKYYLLRFSFFF